MGRAVSANRFLAHTNDNYQHPFFYCCEIDGITDKAVSVNCTVAEKLLDVTPRMRSIRLEQCFLEVVGNLPDGVVVKDIDVLFNPTYQVDVVKLLASAYRKQCFDVVWPGAFDGTRLEYAAEGCADFRAYCLERYDITVIY